MTSSASTSAEPLEYAAAIDSTDMESPGHATDLLPVSASTLRRFDPLTRSTRMPLDAVVARDFRSALTGGRIYLSSPTHGLAIEPSVRIFDAKLPRDWANTIHYLHASDRITIHVVSSAATLRSISRLPSLLNSTDREFGIRHRVESRFSSAVAFAADEWFEDGTESTFARTLSTLIYVYGNAAIAAVERYLGSPDANIEIAVEASQWLGEVEHPDSRNYRKTLLEKTLLRGSTARLRHGAATGLAALDDPSSLPIVVEALQVESNRALRQFLELLAGQLGRTQACPNL